MFSTINPLSLLLNLFSRKSFNKSLEKDRKTNYFVSIFFFIFEHNLRLTPYTSLYTSKRFSNFLKPSKT